MLKKKPKKTQYGNLKKKNSDCWKPPKFPKRGLSIRVMEINIDTEGDSKNIYGHLNGKICLL